MSTPCSVLALDDDPTLQRLLRECLEEVGFEVIVAGNGEEGLAALAKHRVSVIVLDLQMPVMDGRTFYLEARARGYEVPTLMLSSRAEVHALATELGAAGSLDKPFDIDELCAAVTALCAGEPVPATDATRP